jgi:toxic protein SymE
MTEQINSADYSKPLVVLTEDNKHPKQRQLKIYVKYFQRKYHEYSVYPEIRLAGKWLQDLGFSCGEDVVVRFEEDKIIIEKK